MEWIKVLNRHVLLEYNDLRDAEFVAWIKIMALTAELQHEPSREQILKYVHHKTLNSLQEKLMKHSTTLHDVLMKVLRDVQGVLIKREAWKNNKQQLRDDKKNVSMDVLKDVSHIDKIREEKRREEDKEAILIPISKAPVDNSPLPPLPEDDDTPLKKEPVIKKPEQKPQSATSGPETPKPSLGNTHGERWTEKLSAELNTLGDEIRDRYGTRYHGRVQVWVGANYHKKNPAAMVHCLKRLIQERQKGTTIPLPEAYLDAILNGNGDHPGENGKFEAAEAERECDQHKREPVKLGAIFQGIGAGVNG